MVWVEAYLKAVGLPDLSTPKQTPDHRNLLVKEDVAFFVPRDVTLFADLKSCLDSCEFRYWCGCEWWRYEGYGRRMYASQKGGMYRAVLYRPKWNGEAGLWV